MTNSYIKLILQGICPQWMVRDSRGTYTPRVKYVKTISGGTTEVLLIGDCSTNGIGRFINRARNHTWDGWEYLARAPIVKVLPASDEDMVIDTLPSLDK